MCCSRSCAGPCGAWRTCRTCAAQPPLIGPAQAFTLLTNGERTVTLSAVQVCETPALWAAALEGDLWSHLRRRAAARP
ncbi:hypothetical protein ACMT4L_20335 [Deinococcus sp. A31D244]|uniref:hypothetical protein n=1 Tax=Deinococcus sp. A31D244 TaxID=3397675 RepID=UPI0039E0810F